MLKKGYSSYFAVIVPKKFITDLTQNKDIGLKKKVWAYKNGFLSSRVKIYRINESNYKKHIPDFDYYKLSPLNGKYSVWIDDKLTMKYILSPFNEYLPEYYFHIEGSEILKLMECPSEISTNVNGIVELLKHKKNLALKPLSGSLGEGFYKISCSNDSFFINSKISNFEEIANLLASSKNYLITEYINAHSSIRNIYDKTPNTIRIQIMRNEYKKPKVIGSFIRFGTEKSGILETPLAGGIIAGVDVKTGKTFDPNIIIGNELKNIEFHPDTYECLYIEIPRWNEIILKVQEIASYIPQLTYLGFDVIVTNEGFKIIEVNSLTAPTVLSYYYPLLEDEYSIEYFTRKFQAKPAYYKNILKTLDETQIIQS